MEIFECFKTETIEFELPGYPLSEYYLKIQIYKSKLNEIAMYIYFDLQYDIKKNVLLSGAIEIMLVIFY